MATGINISEEGLETINCTNRGVFINFPVSIVCIFLLIQLKRLTFIFAWNERTKSLKIMLVFSCVSRAFFTLVNLLTVISYKKLYWLLIIHYTNSLGFFLLMGPSCVLHQQTNQSSVDIVKSRNVMHYEKHMYH